MRTILLTISLIVVAAPSYAAGGGKKPRPPSYGHTRCGAGVGRSWARMPHHACAYALKEIADAVEHIIHSANTTEH